MILAELLEKLTQLPPHAEVILKDAEGHFCEVEEMRAGAVGGGSFLVVPRRQTVRSDQRGKGGQMARMTITKGEWRALVVADLPPMVVASSPGEPRVYLAEIWRGDPDEMGANAQLMAMAPELASALIGIVDSGMIGGEDHPLDLCGCGNCGVRRLAARARELTGP